MNIAGRGGAEAEEAPALGLSRVQRPAYDWRAILRPGGPVRRPGARATANRELCATSGGRSEVCNLLCLASRISGGCVALICLAM